MSFGVSFFDVGTSLNTYININVQVLKYLVSPVTPGRTMTVNHSGSDIIQRRSNIQSDEP